MNDEFRTKIKEFLRENKKRILAGAVALSMATSGVIFMGKKVDFDKDSTKKTDIESIIDDEKIKSMYDEFTKEYSHEDYNQDSEKSSDVDDNSKQELSSKNTDSNNDFDKKQNKVDEDNKTDDKDKDKEDNKDNNDKENKPDKEDNKDNKPENKPDEEDNKDNNDKDEDKEENKPNEEENKPDKEENKEDDKPTKPDDSCKNHDYDYTTTLEETTDTNHTYKTVGVCEKCGDVTISTITNPHDVDSFTSIGEQGEVGECTVCDYEVKKGHDFETVTSYEELDSDNHTKITKEVCKNDGYISSEVSTSEGHNFVIENEEEVCLDCGYVKECEHENTKEVTSIEEQTETTHTIKTETICEKCGDGTISTITNPHDVDSFTSIGEQGEVGECTVCDYEVKRGHDNETVTSYEELDSDNHTKITKEVCKNDGYISSEVSTAEGHNFVLENEEEVCLDCGYVKECKHENTKDITSLDSQTETMHTIKTETICEKCDTVVDTKYSSDIHAGEFTEIIDGYMVGYCDEPLCGYEMRQPHTHIYNQAGDWQKAYDEEYCYFREATCAECGDVTTEYRDHNYTEYNGYMICSEAGCGYLLEETADQVQLTANKVRSLSR